MIMIDAIIQSKIVNSGEEEYYFPICEMLNCKSFLPSLHAQISWLKQVMDGPSELWFIVHFISGQLWLTSYQHS